MHTMKPRWNAAAGAALLLAGALAPTLFTTTAHAGLRAWPNDGLRAKPPRSPSLGCMNSTSTTVA
jgi:hypothetical protein